MCMILEQQLVFASCVHCTAQSCDIVVTHRPDTILAIARSEIESFRERLATSDRLAVGSVCCRTQTAQAFYPPLVYIQSGQHRLEIVSPFEKGHGFRSREASGMELLVGSMLTKDQHFPGDECTA